MNIFGSQAGILVVLIVGLAAVYSATNSGGVFTIAVLALLMLGALLVFGAKGRAGARL